MKSSHAIIAAFCAIFLLALSLGAAQQGPLPAPEPSTAQVDRYDLDIRILGLEDRPKLEESLRMMARQSRQVIEENTSIVWEKPFIISWTNEQTYREKTGFRPENTAAAASALHGTIWINESAWLRGEMSQNQKTLTHEMGHLLVGSLPGGRDLPVWANEGIVMHLAEQRSWDEDIKLLTAHAFGSLPSLASLEDDFPRDSGAQDLAYRMSYAAVGVLAEHHGDEAGSVRRLLARLSDPVAGPALAAELREDFRRDNWQIATRESLGSRFTTGLVVITSTSALFLIMGVMLFFAWMSKRKRRAERNQQYLDEHEPWEESLTDDDIQDIYGDREGRWDVDGDEERW